MKATKALGRFIVALAMILSIFLLPDQALAADYDVWVGGTRITDANKNNVLGDGTVSFDPTTNTLTLNNATITGALVPDGSGNTAGIYTEVDLIIEMVGESTVTGIDTSELSDPSEIFESFESSWGIGASGSNFNPTSSLTFRGTGGLTVTSGKGYLSVGIYGRGITMESGAISTTGGEARWTSGGISSTSDPFTIEGGTLIVTGGKGRNSIGAMVNGATLNMEGGTLIATGGEASLSIGINLYMANFTMTGGTAEVVGDTGERVNVGLYNEGGSTATITGGTLTLRGSGRGTDIPVNITGYPNPGVIVADNAENNDPEIWNTTTPLNNASFKFVKIQPGQPVPATVSFNPNGGLGAMEDIGTFVGLPVTLPESTFTPPEWKVFKSWKPDSGSVEYNPGDKITVTGNITVEAQWAPIPLTVSFDANGGGGTMEDIETFAGLTVTLPENGFTAPDLDYVFTGWKLGEEDKQPGDKILIEDNITLVAQWERIPATVSFDPNGGIGTMEDIDTFVGLKVTLPENGFTPKDGRVFDGWLVGSEEKQPGDEITVTGDTVVKAQWALTGTGYAVNLNVTKDNEPWSEDAPVITIGTTPETAVENGEQLPNGTYTVTVNNGVSPRELNLKYYTLTVLGGTGIASTEGSGTYLVGQEVTISATVETGYLWTGWKSSNSILMRSSNLRVYTFNMPAGTLTMTGTARRR